MTTSISIARDKRMDALKAGERFAFISSLASEDAIKTAKYKLNDLASELRTRALWQPWSAKMYCRFWGFDFEKSANILRGLATMAGTDAPEEIRRNYLDALYWYLRAHRHLPAERIRQIEQMVFGLQTRQ